MFCSKCGTQVPEKTLFCHKCGASLSGIESAQQTPPIIASASTNPNNSTNNFADDAKKAAQVFTKNVKNTVSDVAKNLSKEKALMAKLCTVCGKKKQLLGL